MTKSTIVKHRIFWKRNCTRFVNVINNAANNAFSSDNSDITNIRTHQIMAIITNWFLKFKLMTKIPILRKYEFFIPFGLSKISFWIDQSYYSVSFMRLILIRIKKMIIKIWSTCLFIILKVQLSKYASR